MLIRCHHFIYLLTYTLFQAFHTYITPISPQQPSMLLSPFHKGTDLAQSEAQKGQSQDLNPDNLSPVRALDQCGMLPSLNMWEIQWLRAAHLTWQWYRNKHHKCGDNSTISHRAGLLKTSHLPHFKHNLLL